MEKQYLPSPSPVGRDSMRVRLIPRTANSVSSSIRAPGWSSRRNATSEVRSAPVAAGTGPGRPTTTNRVTASATSLTSLARTTRPCTSAPPPPGGAPPAGGGLPRPSGPPRAALGVGRGGQPFGVGRVPPHPPPALRLGLRVPADGLDVADRRARARQQRERYRQQQFGADGDVRAGGEFVKRGGDRPLDRVLDRHDRAVRPPPPPPVQRGLHGRARDGTVEGGGVECREGRLGERALRPEIGVALCHDPLSCQVGTHGFARAGAPPAGVRGAGGGAGARGSGLPVRRGPGRRRRTGGPGAPGNASRCRRRGGPAEPRPPSPASPGSAGRW